MTFEFWRIDAAAKVFFAFEIIYGPALGSTKISITFMYFRILQDHRMKVILWATQVLNVLVIISFIFGLFFTCTPLDFYWTYSKVVVGGTCPDVWMYGGYYVAFNIFLDVVLIFLPSQYIWKNILDTRARIGIIAMFCLGLMCVPLSSSLLPDPHCASGWEEARLDNQH